MTAPSAPNVWASAAGANVVTGLTATAAQWQSNTTESRVQYGLIKYTFSGSPTLSAVLAGHRLVIAEGQFTNPENTGSLYIVSADNTAKTITVRMTNRLDNSLDETGATASASVINSGASTQAPSTSKQAQGFVSGEKVNAALFNWKLNQLDTIAAYLLGGESWEVVTTNTSVEPNKKYIANSGSRITFTLPASPTVGQFFRFITQGAGGWKVALNGSQVLRINSVAYSSSVPVQSSGYAAIELVYTGSSVFTQASHEGVINYGTIGYGYMAGGTTGSDVATINKLAFGTTPTVSTLAATLDNSRDFQGGSVGISGTAKGYFSGQYNSGGSAATNVIDDMNFSNDTSAAIAATLSSARTGVSNGASATYGYMVGGYTSTAVVTADRLNLSNDTRSAATENLDAARYDAGTVQSSTTMFVCGGVTTVPAVNDAIQTLLFSSEVTTLTGNTLPSTLVRTTGVSGGTFGLLLGGDTTGGAAYVTTIRKVTYATATTANHAASLTTAKSGGSGTYNTVAGYINGGTTGSVTNVIEEASFITDTTQVISAVLSSARTYSQGVSVAS